MAKVFIVDASSYYRKRMKALLEEHLRAEVAAIGNSEDAVLGYSNFHPDVVVMDVLLPRLSGFEVAKSIHDRDPSALIIFATRMHNRSVVEQSLRLGVRSMLLKPFSDSEFVATVSHGIRLKQEIQE